MGFKQGLKLCNIINNQLLKNLLTKANCTKIEICLGYKKDKTKSNRDFIFKYKIKQKANSHFKIF